MKSFAEKTAERIERLARLHNIKVIAEPFLYEDVEAVRVVIFEGKRAAEDFKHFLQEEVDITYEILEIGYIDNIVWRFLFKILPNSLIRKAISRF